MGHWTRLNFDGPNKECPNGFDADSRSSQGIPVTSQIKLSFTGRRYQSTGVIRQPPTPNMYGGNSGGIGSPSSGRTHRAVSGIPASGGSTL